MLIKVPGMKKPPQFNNKRRPPTEVLGIANPGASARGNSYWKQMRSCPREHALHDIVGLKREGARTSRAPSTSGAPRRPLSASPGSPSRP
jgi:hypothetical protein